MVKANYIPDQGDVVYFNFSPSKGREQEGFRPAVVISQSFLNRANGLAVICPITSQQKSYPFEVSIKTDKVSGAALVDQSRVVDYSARKFKFIARVDEKTILEIKARFIALAQ